MHYDTMSTQSPPSTARESGRLTENMDLHTTQHTKVTEKKKKQDDFKTQFIRYGGPDVIILMLLTLVGVVLPKFWLDSLKSWKVDFPGQSRAMSYNLTFNESFIYDNDLDLWKYYDNLTTITWVTNGSVFLRDPDYSKAHTADDVETVDTNLLLFLAGVLPPMYVFLFLLLLWKWPTKFSYKQFEKEWIWFEFITFMYAFVITMSVAFWGTKSLKILVSWPRPDFYDRCMLNDDDPNDPYCEQEEADEIRKSFKSFPSGHSTNLFAAGVLMVLYTFNKLNIREPFKWKETITQHTWYYRPFIDGLLLWPLFLAGWVASTRLRDHLHTPTDVLGGACIGM